MYEKMLFLRNVIAIVVCLAGSVTMFAQDVIILRNGSEFQAIVQEVDFNVIRYKRFDNPNGPNYTLEKSEVFMIRYENGTVDVFNEIVALTSPQQQLPIQRHAFGNQISPYGSKKDPFLAGFLSFLVPGVGQFYNGDVGAGFVFLGSNILCNLLWMSSIDTDFYGNTYIHDETIFAIGLVGALMVNFLSIIDASQGAKRVNIARGFRLADNTYLQIQPTIVPQNNFYTNNKYAYGMNFRLNF